MKTVAKLSLCAMLSVLPVPLTAGAQVYWDYKTAYMAYDRGDFELAADMYQRLAAGGDVRAQTDLAFLYAVGQGVPQDDGKAVKWYRMAAEAGHAPAQSSLASYYKTGRGVTRDDLAAHKWLNLASILDPNANRRHGATTRRDEIAARLTPDQLATARNRVCFCLESKFKKRLTEWGDRMPPYCSAMEAAPLQQAPPS